MPSYQIKMQDGKSYKVDGPEGYTQEQAYHDLQGHLGPPSGWDVAKDEALGAGKGVLQGFGSVLSQVPGLGTPSVNELDPRVKQWTGQPSANTGQTIGKAVGGSLPFMIGGPEAVVGKGVAQALPFLGRMAGPLGELAGHALVGGASGAAQPTGEGQSRLKNAAIGAAGGALTAPRVAGSLTGIAGGAGVGYGLEQLVRQFGWEPVFGALAGGLGYGLHGGLYKLARRASQMAAYPGKVISNYIPAGLAGGAASSAGKELGKPSQ